MEGRCPPSPLFWGGGGAWKPPLPSSPLFWGPLEAAPPPRPLRFGDPWRPLSPSASLSETPLALHFGAPHEPPAPPFLPLFTPKKKQSGGSRPPLWGGSSPQQRPLTRFCPFSPHFSLPPDLGRGSVMETPSPFEIAQNLVVLTQFSSRVPPPAALNPPTRFSFGVKPESFEPFGILGCFPPPSLQY